MHVLPIKRIVCKQASMLNRYLEYLPDRPLQGVALIPGTLFYGHANIYWTGIPGIGIELLDLGVDLKVSRLYQFVSLRSFLLQVTGEHEQHLRFEGSSRSCSLM